MSTAAIATPPAKRKNVDKLTVEERSLIEAEARDYEDYTQKAIAVGKLTGDFTIDRHILPQPTHAEIVAGIMRIQNEHPERFAGKPVRWAD